VLRLPGLRQVDGLLGGALTACVGLGIAWIAAALAMQTTGSVSLRRDLQQSAILTELNRLLPPSGPILNALAKVDPLPSVTGPPADVPPPTNGILGAPRVRAAFGSVARIVGTACGLGIEGSGWAAGGDLVVTNAHVVAGGPPAALDPEPHAVPTIRATLPNAARTLGAPRIPFVGGGNVGRRPGDGRQRIDLRECVQDRAGRGQQPVELGQDRRLLQVATKRHRAGGLHRERGPPIHAIPSPTHAVSAPAEQAVDLAQAGKPQHRAGADAEPLESAREQRTDQQRADQGEQRCVGGARALTEDQRAEPRAEERADRKAEQRQHPDDESLQVAEDREQRAERDDQPVQVVIVMRLRPPPDAPSTRLPLPAEVATVLKAGARPRGRRKYSATPTADPCPTVLVLGAAAFGYGIYVAGGPGRAERALVTDYVHAWASGSYASMYSLLDSASKKRVSEVRFVADYQRAAATATLQSLGQSASAPPVAA